MKEKTNNLEEKLQEGQVPVTTNGHRNGFKKLRNYMKGCLNPENARLYGNFQERAALNITQFPKIQGSLLIRMGMVYPVMSYLVEKAGLPRDASTDFLGMTVNYHTWVAGYLAYLAEIQAGLSKYPIELVTHAAKKVKNYFNMKVSP